MSRILACHGRASPAQNQVVAERPAELLSTNLGFPAAAGRIPNPEARSPTPSGMPQRLEFSFTFGGDPEDMTVAIAGALDAAELERLNRALISDPRFRPGMRILVDLTGLDTSHLDNDELFFGAESTSARDALAQPLAVAIVAADPAAFEQAVRYRAHLGGTASRRRVFATHSEARDWLGEQAA